MISKSFPQKDDFIEIVRKALTNYYSISSINKIFSTCDLRRSLPANVSQYLNLLTLEHHGMNRRTVLILTSDKCTSESICIIAADLRWQYWRHTSPGWRCRYITQYNVIDATETLINMNYAMQ